MATVAEINSHGKYALNPRGNLWLNDKDKFGERLMKKMGWSEGKGLGKSENGIKENIKVRLKNNNSGVGWKNKCSDVSNSDYDAVLNNLWQNYAEQHDDSSLSVGSLEGRSQKFKNRLHYRKFVHGKDISHYSEKDMQSIFVSKPKEEIENLNQENAEEQEAIINGFQDKLTKNVLTLVDYFNQKLKHKKSNESEKNGTPLNSEATAKYLISDTLDSEQGAECLPESQTITSCKKRKKSKNVTITNGNGIVECSAFTTNNGLDTPEDSCETEEPKKKKKRKKSDVIEEADINGSDNLKFCSPDNSPVKKSKRRKKSNTELVEEEASENQICNGSSNLDIEEALHNSDAVLPNKKRKKTTDLFTKAKKLKSNTISKLKSCLKHNLLKSPLQKQVSFCKDISFRTFASESAVDSMDDEQVAPIDAPDLEIDPSNENIADGKDTEIEKVESTLNVSQPGEINAATKSKTELEPCISETVSPVKQSSVYNSWLDSHRQALKMKMYKSMYKNIKEHYIFQSTNLAQIKGYGNWGY